MTTWFSLEHEWSIPLLAALVHFVWQGLGLGLGVWLASLLLRRGRPELRYALYVGALVLMALCVPVTAWFHPAESMQLGGTDARAVAAEPTAVRPATEAAAPTPGDGDAVSLPAAIASESGVQAVSASAAQRPVITLTAYLHRPGTIRAAWLGWHLGVALLLARLLVGVFFNARLGRRSTAVDDVAILTALGRQAKALGLSMVPPVAWCARVTTPTVVGLVRPMVLLPLSLGSGLSPQQIEMLLCHELAHIRRYDPLVNLGQRIVEALLFYHPAVWYVSRRIRAERELCCDDAVVRLHGTAREYAASLVELAARATGRSVAVAGVGATDRPSQLRRRVVRLLEGSVGSQVRPLRGRAARAAMVLMVLLGGALVYSQTPDDDTKWVPVYRLDEALPAPFAEQVTGVLEEAGIRFTTRADGAGITVSAADLERAQQLLRSDETTRLSALGAEAIETPDVKTAVHSLAPLIEEVKRALRVLSAGIDIEPVVIPSENAFQAPHLVLFLEGAGPDPDRQLRMAAQDRLEGVACNRDYRLYVHTDAPQQDSGAWRAGYLFYPSDKTYALTFHWTKQWDEEAPSVTRGYRGHQNSSRIRLEVAADMGDVESFNVEKQDQDESDVEFIFGEAAERRLTTLSEHLGHRELVLVQGNMYWTALLWTPGLRSCVVRGAYMSDVEALTKGWEGSRPYAKGQALLVDRLGAAPETPLPPRPHYNNRLAVRVVAEEGPDAYVEYLPLFQPDATQPFRWVPHIGVFLTHINGIQVVPTADDPAKRDISLALKPDSGMREFLGRRWAVSADNWVLMTREVREPVTDTLVFPAQHAAVAERLVGVWRELHPEEAAPEPVANMDILQFRWVGSPEEDAGGEELVFHESPEGSDREPVYVLGEDVLNAADIEQLALRDDPLNPGLAHVFFETTPEGAKRLREATSANIGRKLAIVYDGKVITAPVVQATIGGTGQITGSTREVLEGLVAAWQTVRHEAEADAAQEEATDVADDACEHLPTPECRARVAEGDLTGALRTYIAWIETIPVEAGRDREGLLPLLACFQQTHYPDPEQRKRFSGRLARYFSEAADALLREWETAGETGKAALLTWRRHVVSYALADGTPPSRSEFIRLAVDAYPEVSYSDPATQSGLHDLYAQLHLEESVPLIAGTTELETREEGCFAALAEDPRYLYLATAPWKAYYAERFQPRRYEQFLEKVIAAYTEKTQAQPEAAEFLNRYRQAVEEELAALRATDASPAQ